MRRLTEVVLMKLGVGIFEGIPLEENLDLAKAAGFDAVFSDETAAADRAQMARWREGCDRRGLYLETAHCSLAEARGLCIPGEEGDRCLRVLMRNVDNCAEFSVPILVTHASIHKDFPCSYDEGCRRYALLADYAADRGVKIAIENTNSVEFLQRALDALRQENVGFCLDTGHNLCFTPGADLTAFYPRMICCHLHDNDGQRDAHLYPFEGICDFPAQMRKMREAGFDGYLTIEMAYSASYRQLYTEAAFVQKAYDCAVRLREMFTA